MGFPGTWMTESESVVYRVVPKCACSTIGQIMFYSDHGAFFDGDIHDATGGHAQMGDRGQPAADRDATSRRTRSYAFTCVRNPYTRILSSFFDKICGIQRNGKRYRGNLVPLLMQKYGIEVGGDDGKQEFDQIASFRRFLLFARDTIRWQESRWSRTSTGRRCRAMSRPSSSTAGATTRSSSPRSSMRAWATVLKKIKTKHKVDLKKIPKFNESEGHGPKRAASGRGLFRRPVDASDVGNLQARLPAVQI